MFVLWVSLIEAPIVLVSYPILSYFGVIRGSQVKLCS